MVLKIEVTSDRLLIFLTSWAYSQPQETTVLPHIRKEKQLLALRLSREGETSANKHTGEALAVCDFTT